MIAWTVATYLWFQLAGCGGMVTLLVVLTILLGLNFRNANYSVDRVGRCSGWKFWGKGRFSSIKIYRGTSLDTETLHQFYRSTTTSSMLSDNDRWSGCDVNLDLAHALESA